MKTIVIFLSFLILVTCNKETENAQKYAYNALVLDLHQKTGQLQVDIQYTMLKLYGQETLQQVEHVLDTINEHANLTKSESQTFRTSRNATAEINECITGKELALIKAYMSTGYNLHNCIRSTQMGYEKLYSEIFGRLESFKGKILARYRQLSRDIENDIGEDNDGIRYEIGKEITALRKELSTETDASNMLNIRYITNGIAMGCVSSALDQVQNNFNVGRQLMTKCFIQDEKVKKETGELRQREERVQVHQAQNYQQQRGYYRHN